MLTGGKRPVSEPDVGRADVTATFLEAERTGLRLAIKGRLLALVLIGVFIFSTRQMEPDKLLPYIGLFVGYAALGGLHYALIGSRHDRPWIKYVFITVDIAVFSGLVATQPIFPTVDVPQAMAYRNIVFPFYFVILGLAAFSFSPGLVLYAGGMGVACWLAGFAWAIRDMPVRFDWADIGPTPTTERFLEVFLSPNFAGSGSRVQESAAYLVVAVLIAIVMLRARRTVRRQLELDEERRAISDIFGRFVPRAVADAMIADRGALEPVERTATVLFADLGGFTALTEAAGPQRIVRVLNAWFDEVARAVAAHGGIITQFQGDAVLVIFNVPLEDPDHAASALGAALEIRRLAQEKTFGEATLTVRVGISTGPVVAGNVGGGGRQTYTVHGDTVNLAARLEALNKEHGTEILVGASTVALLDGRNFERVGAIDVRGLSAPVDIFRPRA